jgi:hypothetical protein
MAPYPSYTLTIADGVSPVAIGRPKRYRLCLHYVIFVFVHAACVAPFSLSFPERICFPSRVSAQCGSIERARIKHAAAVRAADSTAGCMYVWPHPVNLGKKKDVQYFYYCILLGYPLYLLIIKKRSNRSRAKQKCTHIMGH